MSRPLSLLKEGIHDGRRCFHNSWIERCYNIAEDGALRCVVLVRMSSSHRRLFVFLGSSIFHDAREICTSISLHSESRILEAAGLVDCLSCDLIVWLYADDCGDACCQNMPIMTYRGWRLPPKREQRHSPMKSLQHDNGGKCCGCAGTTVHPLC